MSRQHLKPNNKYFKNSYREIPDTEYNVSQLVIPFSKLFNSHKPIDVYSGKEKIPFNERDPDYKMILRQEFDKSSNIEFTIFKSVIKFPSF